MSRGRLHRQGVQDLPPGPPLESGSQGGLHPLQRTRRPRRSRLAPDVRRVEAALFAEYRCSGNGAAADRLAQREMGGRQLTDEEAAEYTVENIFAAACNPDKYETDWIPAEKVEITE